MVFDTMHSKFTSISLATGIVGGMLWGLLLLFPLHRVRAKSRATGTPVKRIVQVGINIGWVGLELFAYITFFVTVAFNLLSPSVASSCFLALIVGVTALVLRADLPPNQGSVARGVEDVPLLSPTENSADMDMDAFGEDSPLSDSDSGGGLLFQTRGPARSSNLSTESESFLDSITEGIRRRRGTFVLWLCFALGQAVTFFLGSDICIAENPWQLSTSFTRSLHGPSCPETDICHIYVTLAEDPAEFVVHFHTGFTPSNPEILVSPNGDDIWRHTKQAFCFPVKVITEEPRYVCHGIVRALHPSQSIHVKAKATANAEFGVRSRVESRVLRLKSLPADTHEVRFVQGGDIETGGDGEQLWNHGAKLNPDFAILGGDIAYANAFPSCYRRWDQFLWNYGNAMVTTAGNSVPMILAIGNHEAGGFRVTRGDIPFFLDYFVQSQNSVSKPPLQRSLYHHHIVGGQTAVLVLDAWIVTPPGGEQARWLDNILRRLSSQGVRHTILVYHVSLYPSLPEQVRDITKAAKTAWLPIIDKHHVSACLENHYHLYKRSKPLRNDTVVPISQGTLYIGDGSMGVHPRQPHHPYWYTDTMGAEEFILYGNVGNGNLTLRAIRPDGEAFDSVSKPSAWDSTPDTGTSNT